MLQRPQSAKLSPGGNTSSAFVYPASNTSYSTTTPQTLVCAFVSLVLHRSMTPPASQGSGFVSGRGPTMLRSNPFHANLTNYEYRIAHIPFSTTHMPSPKTGNSVSNQQLHIGPHVSNSGDCVGVRLSMAAYALALLVLLSALHTECRVAAGWLAALVGTLHYVGTHSLLLLLTLPRLPSPSLSVFPPSRSSE
eukprot:GHVU01154239.1.p1 GENE.GHVU01154239.1~~GHVU01154239.1.p1  ORF type:complete len:193 (-),score=1.02 GHVU01154239.1:83-661(-)